MATFTEETNAWSTTLTGTDMSVSNTTLFHIPLAEKYVEKDIRITLPKATDITGFAEFSNVGTPTTVETTANIPLVTTAGYSDLNYISKLIIPAKKTIGTNSVAGVTMTAGENTSAYTNLYLAQNDYTSLYLTNDASNYGLVHINGIRSHLYIADQAAAHINNFRLGGTVGDGFISSFIVGLSNNSSRTFKTYIGTLTLAGYNSNTDNPEYINILNVGTNIGYKNAKINTINNYGDIGTVRNTGKITTLEVGVSSGSNNFQSSITSLTLNGFNSIATYPDLINTLNIGTSTTYNNAKINTINNYGTIVNLKNYGTVTTFTHDGSINTFSGSGTISNYSNTGKITTMINNREIGILGTSTTAGSIKITNNQYGTVNFYTNGNTDKGVTVAAHVVTVDGGTQVTDVAGDLILADGDVVLSTSEKKFVYDNQLLTLSDTDLSGVTINGTTEVNGETSITTGGWLFDTGEDGSGQQVIKKKQETYEIGSKYINGIKLTPPASDSTLNEHTFEITVPNGESDWITFTFKVDKDRNVWVE